MKRQQYSEIKDLEVKDILAKVVAAKTELADLILDKNMKKLKDVKVIFKKRKDIAQMLTVVRQKQLLREMSEARADALEEKVENKKEAKAIKVKKETK